MVEIEVVAKKISAVVLCGVLLFSNCGIKMNIAPLGSVPVQSGQNTGLDPQEYWDLIQEIITSPQSPPSSLKHAWTFFKNDLTSDGFCYVYGVKTAYKVQKGTSKDYPGVLACYLDDDDYSGVTVALGAGNSVDLEPFRKKKAPGIGFWMKAGEGVSSVYFGLLDDESDGKKVQTKVSLKDFGTIDTTWRYFMIPLKKLSPKGKYWDAAKKMEIISDIRWKEINEARFSVNKGENNRVGREKPIKVYIEHITVIEDIPGYIDPDDYWISFSSQAPDVPLHDFETAADQEWATAAGPSSQVSFTVENVAETGCGKKTLSITYRLGDWCDVMYDYRRGAPDGKKRDWTKHWGLKLMFYTEKSYQAVTLQISDAGNEIFYAPCGASQGWNEVIVPFREFRKFPYYQPPEAVHNGTLDLADVAVLDIKPAGEATSGSFMIDNIMLTNARAVTVAPAAAQKEIEVSGSFSKVIAERVPDGIFGINALHWDGDLLRPETADLVKAVGHKVIRFPGGLSADEYHWQKILSAKDENVDIDEFLAFCRRIACEPMITVNFGTGTAEEAAAWVQYVNIEKKAGVRYWEIGNELYGDWHKNHCDAGEYGKRAAEFITAMKRVDPAILITVVWELEGKWNKTVFDHTKEIADGVNIHNYPQESGEENDGALLAAAQSLDGIIGGVRRQLSAHGVSGKKYQIWLTEWNSIDFNPGPQSLGIVNALFVVDYLGMLAKLSIEQASYWNIHNGIFESGGDYGYLTRSDVPEGPNAPRPTYRSFKLASESLRGKVVQCFSSDINVSVYANEHPDGAKSLLIINKYPRTTGVIAINCLGFEGSGTVSRLLNGSGKDGYTVKPLAVKTGMKFHAPPYSVSVLRVK